jgi:hypothetical protein
VTAALVVAALLGASGGAAPAAFRADFPAAQVLESPSGGRLTLASGFRAPGAGDTAGASALAFLERYGPAFGIGPRQSLVVQSAPPPGQPGTVRLARRIEGAPLYGGDMAVEVDADRTVVLVSAGDVPAEVEGTPRISRKAAIKAARKAISGLEAAGEPRAERGWRTVGAVVRPVWRVDLAARKPAGDWRTFVDAENGKVLLRVDLRVTGSR